MPVQPFHPLNLTEAAQWLIEKHQAIAVAEGDAELAELDHQAAIRDNLPEEVVLAYKWLASEAADGVGLAKDEYARARDTFMAMR